MRRYAALAFALLALMAWLAVPAAAAPRLRIASGEGPLTIAGSGFRPHERVRVTVQNEGPTQVRRVRASRGGHFSASFSVEWVRCGGGMLWVTARGSLGSRASLKRPAMLCPVLTDP